MDQLYILDNENMNDLNQDIRNVEILNVDLMLGNITPPAQTPLRCIDGQHENGSIFLTKLLPTSGLEVNALSKFGGYSESTYRQYENEISIMISSLDKLGNKEKKKKGILLRRKLEAERDLKFKAAEGRNNAMNDNLTLKNENKLLKKAVFQERMKKSLSMPRAMTFPCTNRLFCPLEISPTTKGITFPNDADLFRRDGSFIFENRPIHSQSRQMLTPPFKQYNTKTFHGKNSSNCSAVIKVDSETMTDEAEMSLTKLTTQSVSTDAQVCESPLKRITGLKIQVWILSSLVIFLSGFLIALHFI